MAVRWRQFAYVVLLATGIGCARQPIFVDAGVGNGSSAPFALHHGSSVVDYATRDREPWLGCTFGLALVAQDRDPLAPGRVVSQTDVIAVSPRAELHGTLATPLLTPGTYYLRYLGDQPCEWSVSLTAAGL